MAKVVSISAASRSIETALKGMVDRAKLAEGYLNRVVYREYQNAQRERWVSENAGSDFKGGIWDRLTIAYQEMKFREFYDYPGHGEKMLIATKRLFDATVGPPGGTATEHTKLVDNHSIRVLVSVPYAKYVDEHRTFTQWSEIFYRRIYGGLKDYLVRNIVKSVQ